jgi:ribose 5-phosphate isomerase A
MSIHNEQDRLKQVAGNWAAAQLRDGMIVGLGSGSTARLAVETIGQRVREGLRIIGIPTSEQTAEQAQRLGIPLATLGDYQEIDIAIDGADEVELGTLNLIKGGGGNQLREKIVAAASLRFLVIVDESKLVHRLGERAKVPVEVAPFGWQATARALEKRCGGQATLRGRLAGEPFLTDGGNYILDCSFGTISSPAELQNELDRTVGVLEHGLFLGMAGQVAIGAPEGLDSSTETPVESLIAGLASHDASG